jgi:inhibitor of cysteine peptidase
MKSHHVVIILCIVCLVAAFSAGCTSQSKPATPAATPAPASTPAPAAASTQVAKPATPVTIATSANGYYTFTESENKGDYYVTKNNLIYVDLDENPTTGYVWNLSATKGLTIVSDEYLPPSSTSGVGAGGTHEWTIKPTGDGYQTITAVLKRPTDKTTGLETTWMTGITITTS